MARTGVIPSLCLALLAAAGCGSSAQRAAPATTASRTTATTAPVTSAATTVSAPISPTNATVAPPPTTRATTTRTATTASAATTTAAASTPQSQVVQESVCPSEQGAGILADFGHRRDRAAAAILASRAQGVGFQGLIIQRRSCKDFAVVLPGLRTLREAKALGREAARAGFHVTLECRSRPVQGGLAAVFGHRRTRRAAIALRRRAAAVGFRELQVVQDRCRDWVVELFGLGTAAERAAFSKEAARAGFHITYEPG